MSDYTPTENEIAEAYNRDAANVAVRFGVVVNEAVEKSEAEVRRALAEMKARAWDEGHAAGMDEGHGATIIETNPYKEAE